MTPANRRGWMLVVLMLTAAFVVLGCNQNDGKGTDTQAKAKGTDTADTVHSDWWCQEHGIPEEICGLCNKKYRDEKKAQGDWCADHKRLKSQCFKCDPGLYEREFEPMYVAKYGKKPERPPETEFQK